MKIFREAQVQALLNGEGCISERMIQRAVDILAIKVPKTFAGGTHISDFSFEEDKCYISFTAETVYGTTVIEEVI